MDIAGGVAVVTGAAVGSGRSIAVRLATEGAAVVIGDVDDAGLAQTAELIEAAGGGVTVRHVDMTVADEVRNLIGFGAVDILVNNAGGGGATPPHYPDASPSEWGALVDLNLRGPMLATQLALDLMEHGGAVVNVASSAGLAGGPTTSPEYAAAKAGLIRFTSALASLARARVNCVVPEWLATERAQAEWAAMDEAERRATAPPIPLAEFDDAVVRLITDDDLAGRVLVLPQGRPAYLLDPGAGVR